MKIGIKTSLSLALLGATFSSYAQDTRNISYSFFELGIGTVEADVPRTDVDGNMFAGSISYELSDYVFVGVSMAKVTMILISIRSSFNLALVLILQ